MALTLLQIVEGEKSFKGKSIAEIAYSFWILDISPSLKDGEWTFSVEMFNQGHGRVLHNISNIGLVMLDQLMENI